MVWSKNKSWLLLISSILVVLLIAMVFIVNKQSVLKIETVAVGDYKLAVKIADRPDLWEKGLVGVNDLTDQQGMIFIFPDSQERVFWMKDMSMSIDLLWIKDGQIVGLVENMVPQTDPPFTYYHSPVAVDMVLEVASGWASRQHINIGQKVSLDN